MSPRIVGPYVFALAAALQGLACTEAFGDQLPIVRANDNRQAAGRLRGDTLTLGLTVMMARWYPEADDGPYIEAPVFAEEGRPPQVPGPLIRVREGTVVDITLRNPLSDSTLWVHGLVTRPAAADSTPIAPGAAHRFVFAAGAPGTYFYRAHAGHVDPDVREREQLAGAFVIDSANGRNDDRVFVINIWGEGVDSTTYRNGVAINGKSWPYTERIAAAMGDSVRWRWVNASIRPHPMHLHGFYFRIDAKGFVERDTVLTSATQRMAVTELMQPFQTMSIVWSPDRPGNWLFHCHLAFHVIPETRLDPPARHDRHDGLSQDADRHMAGLVLGMRVSPSRAWKEPPRESPVQLRLLSVEGKPRGRSPRAMAYVLDGQDKAASPDALQIPGPVIVLERDRAADITVVNRLPEATAVHWHGLELESFSDGVAGWSGEGTRLAPIIAPNDSFVARLTVPRAGTFIYHTHLSDVEQITSGLYGAIVVVEPGKPFDPRRDHVFVNGWDGAGEPPHMVINGDSMPGTLEFERGVVQRLRFVNIAPAVFVRFRMMRDAVVAPWRRVARDGFDLPESQRRLGPFPVVISVGQTFDLEFMPVDDGPYVLEAHSVGGRLVRRWKVKVIG
jgi:FtsP/CotA-like multicopper oxidase with cupredoxin domain